jgi:hypothetical protein
MARGRGIFQGGLRSSWVWRCPRGGCVITSAPSKTLKLVAATLRRAFPLLAIALLAGRTAWAQLPPPDRILTEPRATLLHMGPLDLHARAVASIVYDDNISLHDRPRRIGIEVGETSKPLGDDVIHTFSPGVLITKPATIDESHTAFALDYSPSFIFFLKNSAQNSIDHNAKMNAGYAFTKLTLGLVQNFSATEGAVVDVGDRVKQRNYQTGLTVRYELTEKTYLLTEGGYRLTDYETLTDSQEWSATTTANYQISSKVTLGLGVTVGQLFVDEQILQTNVLTDPLTGDTTPNSFIVTKTRPQTYVGPTLRALYKTTEKTDISLTFGGEWRSYADGSDSFGPVFALAGNYRPLEGTTLTLEGHRRQQNSAVISGANYTSTGVSMSARQRLRERLFGTLALTYNHSDYESRSDEVETDRRDDYYLLRCGLEAILGKSWSIGLFYQYREDISTDERYSFNNNQVGIQAAWGF